MNELVFPVLGVGAALPRRCVSNDELVRELTARGVETSGAWIKERTGIAQRYLCGEGETTFTLARDAVVQAMDKAGVSAADVGAVVVATCTPDLTFPSVAALVHGALGLPRECAALDVNAACSGFVYALAVVRGLMAGKVGKVAILVGAESFSKVVDWHDRGTCVRFGDGAGAMVLGCELDGAGRGLLGVELGADGSLASALTSTGGVATTQTAGVVQMSGREVYKHAVRQMGAVPPLLADLGLTLDDVDVVVPHQANTRILDAAAEMMGVPPDKVLSTVALHANTSAASIPLALAHGVETGRIKPGMLSLLQAFGAGFTFGTALVRF